jgi:hypothetical protein
MESMREFVEKVIRVMDVILIVSGIVWGSFTLGYNWKRPQRPDLPRTIATSVAILSVRSDGEAYQEGPIFEGDNLYKLQDEHGDAIVGILTSVELARYQHLRWVVSLAQDFQADFALSARAAYLTRLDRQPLSFSALNWSGRQGPPYREIAVEVPQPEEREQIVMTFSIYPTTHRVKFLSDINRMLTTHVE